MPISDPFRNPTGVIPRVRTSYLAGAAPGALTLTGISERLDRILSVQFVATFGADGVDLTDEFTITADDTIDNTGGTDTSLGQLVVTWNDHDWGAFEDAPWQE